MDADATSSDAQPTPGSLFRETLARVAARTERNQPPPPPPIVTKAPNAAAFLKVAAPMLLPRADFEFMALELARRRRAARRAATTSSCAAVPTRCSARCGRPSATERYACAATAMTASRCRRRCCSPECLAEAEANVKQVSGPASLAEAFSRQIAFRRRWQAPEKTGGLRIFSRRRPAEDARPAGARDQRVALRGHGRRVAGRVRGRSGHRRGAPDAGPRGARALRRRLRAARGRGARLVFAVSSVRRRVPAAAESASSIRRRASGNAAMRRSWSRA